MIIVLLSLLCICNVKKDETKTIDLSCSINTNFLVKSVNFGLSLEFAQPTACSLEGPERPKYSLNFNKEVELPELPSATSLKQGHFEDEKAYTGCILDKSENLKSCAINMRRQCEIKWQAAWSIICRFTQLSENGEIFNF